MRFTSCGFTIIVCQYLWIPQAIAQLCYDQTGAAAPNQYTCGNTADSACCSAGDICYSDGLCGPSTLNADGRTFLTPFFWGGCTDPAYNTDNCFSKCFNKSGNGVQSCPNAGSNHYCCYGLDGCDCTDTSQVFTLPAANIITTIALSVTRTSSSSSTSSTPSTSTTPTSTTSTSTTSTSSLSNTSTSSVVVFSPISSPTNTSVPQKSSNNAVGIGVGVGVGALVVIGIIGAAYFLMRRRKKAAMAGKGEVYGGAGIDNQNSEMKDQQTSPIVHVSHELGENNVSELHEGTYDGEYYHEMPAHRSGG